MVLLASLNRFAGIGVTQVGEPLADSVERARNDLNADRLVAATPTAADAEAKDEEVAQLVFLGGDVRQVGLVAVFKAEGCPEPPSASVRLLGFWDEGVTGDCKRSAEVSAEIISGRGVSRFQGVACGCACVMWEWKEESVRCCRREQSSAPVFWGPGM